jgi:hypothetical protein
VASGGQSLPTERCIQRGILDMLRKCFPHVIYHHAAVTKLAGTGKQRGMQMGAMKGDGFRVGFPDLALFWAPRTGAMIECKRPKTGKVSEEQAKLHEALRGIGWPVAVVTSIDEAYTFLRECGAPWAGIDPRANPPADCVWRKIG